MRKKEYYSYENPDNILLAGLSLSELKKKHNIKNNFHGYLYSRVVNNPNLFERYSGIPRDISRYGFTSGETDQSGICFENEWLIFQFGRGRERWGAGNDIQ